MSVDPTRIDIEFDPLLRRMEGVAHHGATPFSVPFISHIDGNLWTGGCTDGLVLPAGIEHVVSLYPWESYRCPVDVRSVLEVRMYDSLDQAMEQVVPVARWVNSCLADGPTLVHCQAGLNRSGLVAGAALVLGGMAPADAIALLRARRSPAVLCNPTFERWLLDESPPFAERDPLCARCGHIRGMHAPACQVGHRGNLGTLTPCDCPGWVPVLNVKEVGR